MVEAVEITQPESRVKKTLLNARVNLIFYFLTLALSFFSRKIFLDCLGSNFIGLSGTLQNILGFLNLAELGIGSSIGYVLYKPIFENNRTQISQIISVMGYLYRWIGYLILGAGIILSCFLPIIFPDSQANGLSLPLIFCVYYGFLTSSLIGYFVNYKQTLLGADQRNYVVTAYFQGISILKTLIQMYLAYITKNLYLWVLIEFVFGIIYAIILNWKISQTYPWLKTEVSKGKEYLKQYPLIIKNTKQIFLHKIGIVTQFQATPLLIYAFVSLKMVAYYENYTLLLTKISGLLTSVLGSSEAATGNLIAEGNTTKVKQVFWEMMTLRYWISGIIVIGVYFLMPPFIVLWLGPSYLLSKTILILVIINIAIQLAQSGIGQFIYGYGLFNDVWATLVQAGLFLILAFFGGKFMGLAGIILSSIITLFLAYCVWKPYYLFHYGFKESIITYLKDWVLLFVRCLLFIGLCVYLEPYLRIVDASLSFFNLIIYAIIITLLSMSVSLPCMLMFNPHSRKLVLRFLKK